MERTFLTAKETAEYLRVSDRTVDSWREKGMGPPYYLVGGVYKYATDDLETWLKNNRVDPGKGE